MIWIKRLLLVFLTIIFSSTITFVVIRTMPGDPVETLAMELQRNMGMSLEDAMLRAKAMLNYDPNVPIITQYLRYVSGLLRGNFGISMQFRAPVMSVVGNALAWTLLVSSTALLISFVLGSLLGMYCAWKRKTLIEPIVTVYDAILGAVPAFVIAYLLVLLFSVKLGWLPARGNYDASVAPGFTPAFIASVAKHAVLPVLSWVLTTIGGWALGMKAIAVSTLGEDFITSARARGLPDRRIVWTYVGRNALLPQVTALAMQFGMMFAGSALIENIFVYPGMGFFFARAITARDYMLMQGMFMIITIAVVIANLLAEVLYSVIDPRIREAS
ncbi:MAG: ABC transporter permease [Christensenellales bacterium]